MPSLSNILICDMPLRFDTYKGCSHLCEYCFVKNKTDISKIEVGESPKTLLNFINKRKEGKVVEKIFNYDIPIHWGGVSDPFQPVEKSKRLSLECLKVFRQTQYPFVVSTKNALLASDEYLDVLKDCNCAVQYSAVCSSYDAFEKGASTFLERVEAMRKIALHKRVIVRAQPLIPKVKQEFIKNIQAFKDAGVYGITVEFMKYKYKVEGTERVRGDFVFPLKTIKPIFEEVKVKANNAGIKVFAGENRLRQYGDGLNCCGVGDLWKSHVHNLNHLLFDNERILIEDVHRIKGAVEGKYCTSMQNKKEVILFKNLNVVDILNMSMTDKSFLSNYTIDAKALSSIKNFKPFC